MGSVIGLVAVLLVVGAGVAYVQFIGPNAAVKVQVMVASPREVVRLYDGTSPVKKVEPQSLAFGEAGKVSDVVAVGTEVKPGMPLASLEVYAATEKAMADVRDRAAFYEKQQQAAQAKGNAEATKAAESEVAEKKKLLADLEARAAKQRLAAPSSGTVSEVLVTAGGDAKVGEPAIRISDKRLTVDFKVPPVEAGAFKPDSAVSLQAASGGAIIAGRVAKAEGDIVTVELLSDIAAKAGDPLRLVRSRMQNVIPVPPTAVVKREGADVVYVLSNGEAKARKITIVDRTPTEVLIAGGLATGDSVIKSNVELLRDGKKALPQ